VKLSNETFYPHIVDHTAERKLIRSLFKTKRTKRTKIIKKALIKTHGLKVRNILLFRTTSNHITTTMRLVTAHHHIYHHHHETDYISLPI
jgi:hypothetical protein